jgi:predicted metal-dependent phosphoesterase TrpH
MLKMEMHLHTQHSIDSLLKLESIINICRKKGINAVAVTDHGTIEGAERLKAKVKETNAGLKVITGEEIFTTKGEIIGLFLKESIPSLLSPTETIRRIREQGGLVYIPHPFIPVMSNCLGKELHQFADEIDIIEVFNTRSMFGVGSKKARRFASQHNIAPVVASDVHVGFELGNAHMELEDFNGPEEFLANLRKAKRVISSRGWLFIPLSYGLLWWGLIKRKVKL